MADDTAVEEIEEPKIIVQSSLTAPIVEIFASIQGEGKYIGVPSIFIRFYGCTLCCQFNGESCDTPYAVTGDGFKQISIGDIVHVLRQFPTINHIVFTGGEPLLHQEFLIKLIAAIHNEFGKDFFTFEIETNGTVEIYDRLVWNIDWCNISVKLKSSNQKDTTFDKKRINHVSLHSFIVGRCCFKFVVNGEYDLAEILDMKEKYPKVPIYVMPQGVTRDDILTNSENVVNLAIANNFIFTTRLHIILWDKKRGV